MRNNRNVALSLVAELEAGIADIKNDRGGLTRYGVTRPTWEEWIKETGGVLEPAFEDVGPADAAALFEDVFWHRPHIDDLPDGLDVFACQLAVNAGARGAVRILQGAVGVTRDGVIGPATLQAASRDPRAALESMIAHTRDFYVACSRHPGQAGFLPGWLHRCDRAAYVARRLVIS